VIDLDSVLLSDLIRWNSSATNVQQNVFLIVPEPSPGFSLIVGWVLVVLNRKRMIRSFSSSQSNTPFPQQQGTCKQQPDAFGFEDTCRSELVRTCELDTVPEDEVLSVGDAIGVKVGTTPAIVGGSNRRCALD
jgi:hypothetical protein